MKFFDYLIRREVVSSK